MTEPARLRKGQEISLEVCDLDAEGEGVAYVDGRALTVPLAIPGDRVRARVLRPGREPVPTRPLAREAAAPTRTGAACPHYETCGGCAWQDVRYSEQLRLKEQIVRANLPGVPPDRFRPILGMETPWFYRNKMEYTFSEGPILGLHRRGRYWDVLDIVDCRLQSPLANEIRNAVRAFAQAYAWEPYHKRTHTGEVRHLVIREGKRTGEVLLNLATRSEAVPGIEELVRQLVARFPAITSFYWTISPEKGDAIKAHREMLLHGKPQIREVLDGIEFLIGPKTFFQTNTVQAEELCRVVAELREAAGHGTAPVVLDLYCGVGTFALSTARRAPGARVFGVELVEESVASARENAARNGIPGVEFLAGDVGKRLPEAIRALGTPDVVLVDPPRAGLAPEVVGDLAALSPAQILYISCNPAALGRDLAALTAAGYQVRAVQPVDMFPHTRHVETCVSITRVEE
ncbi:MAG: 23S rRNA (uracil(1939)-C(5))-methyltransferase RlmD [Armatimonadetes bacterium]|nr:23S rRNA (uracil(1939)-C(5))-methyltransferase RlmD [Armatimonadota bacterium]